MNKFLIGLSIVLLAMPASATQVSTNGLANNAVTNSKIANGTIDLTTKVTGTLPAANGGTGSMAFTAGSVLFSNGTILTQDNPNFFWDNTNDRLGLGVAAPTVTLDIFEDTAPNGGEMFHVETTSGNAYSTVKSGTASFIQGVDTDTDGFFGMLSDHPLSIRTNNINRVVISNTGTSTFSGHIDFSASDTYNIGSQAGRVNQAFILTFLDDNAVNAITVSAGQRTLADSSGQFTVNWSDRQLLHNGDVVLNWASGEATMPADLFIKSFGGVRSEIRLYDNDDSNYAEVRAPAVIGSNTLFQLPDSNGTSGQFLQTDGTGILTWATSSGGANVTLSNLTNPTAINQDLIFDKGTDATLKTKNETAATSKSLEVFTGNLAGAGAFGTGNLSVVTGTSANATQYSGNAIFGSGSAGSAGSGNVNLLSGGSSTGGPTGTITIITGNAGGGASGDISLVVGTATTTRGVIKTNGHIRTQGTAPVVSACGTGPSVAGNDVAGRVTIGTGGVATSCTVTFNQAFTTAPACIVNDESISLLVNASATTTVLTITAPTPFGASDLITYHCLEY